MPVVGNRMTPLDRLVYWITERESIRIKKEAGEPPPWTADPILRAYRFCNVRRMDDKVSRWLLENWYEPYRDHPNALYAAALARFINLPASLDQCTSYLFGTRGPVDWVGVSDELRHVRSVKGVLFNGAYMVRCDRGVDKVDYVVRRCVGSLTRPGVAVDPASMERTHKMIVDNAYGLGSFMAGQVAADLRWAVTGSWRDRNDWAPLGPGSVRGVNRVLGAASGRGVSEMMGVIERVRDLLPESIGSRLEAMDYQNCLCEYDKYERARLGEGRPKQRYRGAGDESVRGQ